MTEFTPASGGRFHIEEIDGTSFLVARTNRNWGVIILLLAATAIWLRSFWPSLMAMSEIPLSHWPYLLGLAVRLLLGGLGFCWLSWELGGRMAVGVSEKELVYRWSMLPISRTRRYETRWIRNVRMVKPMERQHFGRFSYYGCPPFFYFYEAGRVGFDYFSETKTIMPGLDADEGIAVSLWIKKQLDLQS